MPKSIERLCNTMCFTDRSTSCSIARNQLLSKSAVTDTLREINVPCIASPTNRILDLSSCAAASFATASLKPVFPQEARQFLQVRGHLQAKFNLVIASPIRIFQDPVLRVRHLQRRIEEHHGQGPKRASTQHGHRELQKGHIKWPQVLHGTHMFDSHLGPIKRHDQEQRQSSSSAQSKSPT